MTRYIDADALIEKTKDPYRYCDYEYSMYADGFIEDINNAPTIDAVEVVRCKDCRWWQDNNNGYPHANCHWCETETPDEDDFCSMGERKTE